VVPGDDILPDVTDDKLDRFSTGPTNDDGCVCLMFDVCTFVGEIAVVVCDTARFVVLLSVSSAANELTEVNERFNGGNEDAWSFSELISVFVGDACEADMSDVFFNFDVFIAAIDVSSFDCADVWM